MEGRGLCSAGRTGPATGDGGGVGGGARKQFARGGQLQREACSCFSLSDMWTPVVLLLNTEELKARP